MKRTQYLAFDIETARITDDASDWKSQRPLGISCAATLLADADQPTLWHGGTDRASPKDRMSREEAAALVRYLEEQAEAGYTDPHLERARVRLRHPCRGISDASPNAAPWRSNHVDMMFHVFCRLGHGVGLDAAARGMGVAGKPEGMRGELAPVLWAEGGAGGGACATSPRTCGRRWRWRRLARRAGSFVGSPAAAETLDAVAGGMAGGVGSSGIAAAGYFLDDGPVAEGEVHGVDAEEVGRFGGLVFAMFSDFSFLGGNSRSPRTGCIAIAASRRVFSGKERQNQRQHGSRLFLQSRVLPICFWSQRVIYPPDSQDPCSSAKSVYHTQ